MSSSNLRFKEVERLAKILDSKHQIHGKGNFPIIEVEPRTLIQAVQKRLIDAGVGITGVILNGSAASHCIAQDYTEYKDLDIIFKLEHQTDHPATRSDQDSVTCKSIPQLQQQRHGKSKNTKRRKSADETDNKRWTIIRDTVMTVILSQLPTDVKRDRLTTEVLLAAYVNKLIKINNENDKWSLISLTNNKGRNLELKFVESMRRQFEFSVDSFQVMLDSYLAFSSLPNVPINASFFPQIEVHSVYGDITEARQHLDQRLIVTKNPEQIRGGGLLRYCNLITRGFHVIEDDHKIKFQSLMSSRFFIDFPDIETQTRKLESYLINHFNSDNELEMRFNFLLSLQMVVDESTICLMSHERKLVLDLIMKLAKQTLGMILRQEGYQIETSVPVVQPVPVPMPIQLPIKLSKKARRKMKKNKALQQATAHQAAMQHHHHVPFPHQYQPCVPFVTYSKVEDMIPTRAPTEIVYDVQPPATTAAVSQVNPASSITYEKVNSTSPPSSSGLSSMADSDSDSLRSPECLEEDWSSNSGESSSGVYVDDSLSGSRSPSPQKTGYVYSVYHCEQPDSSSTAVVVVE